MRKVYLVQMEEIVVEGDSRETVEVWDDIYDYTYDLEEAKRNALQLLKDIKQHKVSEIFEVNDANNHIGVCISEYDEDDDSNIIADVIEIGMLTPKEWNVTCGSCGAYCEEGTCFKYGNRVSKKTIASDCWHRF